MKNTSIFLPLCSVLSKWTHLYHSSSEREIMVAYWILCNIDVGLLTENQLIKPPEFCLQAKVKSTVCVNVFLICIKIYLEGKRH